jgi:hypothetical protein
VGMATTAITDLTTASPVEIDTEIARPRTVKAEPLIVDVGPISQGGWRVSIYQGSSGDHWVHVADFSDEADAVEAAEVLAGQLPQATLQRTEDAW